MIVIDDFSEQGFQNTVRVSSAFYAPSQKASKIATFSCIMVVWGRPQGFVSKTASRGLKSFCPCQVRFLQSLLKQGFRVAGKVYLPKRRHSPHKGYAAFSCLLGNFFSVYGSNGFLPQSLIQLKFNESVDG